MKLGVPDDHADDLVQEVFAVILAQYHRFDGKDDMAWAFTIARYELLTWRSAVRRAAPRQEQLRDDIPVDPVAEARLAEIELLAACEAFRSTLDPVATMLFDHLGSDLPDDGLIELIDRTGGVRLTLGALRGRRMRTREAFAGWLRARGLR